MRLERCGKCAQKIFTYGQAAEDELADPEIVEHGTDLCAKCQFLPLHTRISLNWTAPMALCDKLAVVAMLLNLKIRSLQKFVLIRSLLFVVGVTIPPPTLAQAQMVFHLSKEVHWGDAVLPSGDYVITSLDVVNSGAVLTFARPDSQSASTDAPDLARQEAVSSGTSSANGELFTIVNPRNQTVPEAEVQTIYRSACRVVEKEFSRSEPVRPRLTLLLGADRNSLYYPKREIRLRKWDKYKFAQGVVILALDDLMPEDKKLSLSKLAVLEADSTVDVRLLKSSRSWLPATPHN